MRDEEIVTFLKRESIEILHGFIENTDLVRRFYRTYYQYKSERIVLCRINPGRKGAGKTGIPFLDFKSVSKLLPDIMKKDKENSTQFIWSVINEIGRDIFFKNVYMTNISWFGFTRNGRNYNYHKIRQPIQARFTENFIEEMDIVKPTVIIPLGVEVANTLKRMKKEGKLQYPI
mgnify:CR=1 FL=1